MKTQVPSSFVDVKVVTWLKDSHGLFDYESKKISLKRLRVDSHSRVYREDENIIVQNSDNIQTLGNLDKERNFLFSVNPEKAKNGQFSLAPASNLNTSNNTNYPFLVVRSLKNDAKEQCGYELEAGDVIRFGRIEYRVLEYRDHTSKIHSVTTDSVDCPFSIVSKNCDSDDSKKQCRICLMDDQDTDEALINPCSCKGTSGYLHISCLQNWISMKMSKKQGVDVSCSYWKKLNCEVCKASLPDVINLAGEKKELVPIERPETPYIIVERLYYDEVKEKENGEKMVIQLCLSNMDARIKLGRGHECDIRENDISVSRLHAYMKFQNGKFAIYDNSSKFGTLVLLRKNFNLDKKKVALQIGKTVLAFTTKSISPPSVKTLRPLVSVEKSTRQQLHVRVSNNRPKMSLNDLGTDRFERIDTNVNLNGSFLD